jgi:hypothetical protein
VWLQLGSVVSFLLVLGRAALATQVQFLCKVDLLLLVEGQGRCQWLLDQQQAALAAPFSCLVAALPRALEGVSLLLLVPPSEVSVEA